MKFYKSCLNSNSNRATYKEFLGVCEPAFVMFGDSFLEFFIDPFTLKGHNFLISNLFLIIIAVSNASRGGFKIYMNTRYNKALPLDLACLEHLSVWSLIDFPYFFEQFDE